MGWTRLQLYGNNVRKPHGRHCWNWCQIHSVFLCWIEMKTLSILIISTLIGVTLSILAQLPFASSESGFSNGSEDGSTNISNMSLVLYDKFEQVSSNSTKDLYLEFYDEKNKTLVKNVSFFVNATKGDTVLIHELFYTHTGSMTLKFSPGSDTGKLIINGTAEPTLGGMMSDNDILPIEMSAFTPGTYHFHIEALALVDTNHIVDQSNPPTFDSWWSVDDKGNISKDTNSTTVSKTKNASPMQQFKSGVAADDVKCGLGLQLVIKTKDGSPACARPQTAQKLVERKWGWAMQPIDSIKPLPNRISGFENDVGMVSLKNQTYYFDTPNYTKTSYIHPVQITFHDVNFTLFPPGFRGGLPLGGCPGQYYWVDAKFADDTAELLHIYAGSQSCADSVPIMLSNHILPQAGLTFSDGKMMLLVRDENQPGKDIVLQKPSSMVKPFPQCNQNPAKEKLIREKQQTLTDALLSEEK